MESIFNLTLLDLEERIIALGGKKFNASQIYEWIYKKKVSSFKEMTNINKQMIEKLELNFMIDRITIEKRLKSRDGTVKYLFKIGENEYIETVLMKHQYGNSVCVTTQLGCNMGCTFCASGIIKKQRNLKTFEIVKQVYEIMMLEEIRVSHIVVMGIGEPFDNYDNMMKFIHIVNNPKGLEIGARHITVSTCGLVPKIKQFADENIQVNLAISLHAPNNRIRDLIMPINSKYPIEELIDACKYYIEKTNRRITFEYILLNNVNISQKSAHELSDLIRGMNAYLNLIPYNSVLENDYKRVSKEDSMKFYDIMKKRGINCTLRREKGHDIQASCGQLRSEKTNVE